MAPSAVPVEAEDEEGRAELEDEEAGAAPEAGRAWAEEDAVLLPVEAAGRGWADEGAAEVAGR